MTRDTKLEEDSQKNEAVWNGNAEIRTEEFLIADEAFKVITTSGFSTQRTSQSSRFSAEDDVWRASAVHPLYDKSTALQ